ncbi:MAG: hypothetical protein ACYDBQ_03390 [Thermoplasmatota archaeon]
MRAAVVIALLLAGCATAPAVPSAGATGAATVSATTSPAAVAPGAPVARPIATPSSVASAPAPVPDPWHWKGVVDVQQSIFVLPWDTLVIDPGTTIRFHALPDVNGTPWGPTSDGYVQEHNDPTGHVGYQASHFTIYGKIVAVGTQAQPIRFTSANATPGYADWDQLVLSSGSRLENVTVEYAHDGIDVQGDDVVLANVTAHDSLWSCIDVFGARARLRDVEAYHCWHQAVGFKGPGGGSLTNAFLHDSQVAVNCEDGANPTLAALRVRAAFMAPACPPVSGMTNLPGGADVAGGTYHGVLIYPYQG